jgi:membrane-associated phospholipid phosphatase
VDRLATVHGWSYPSQHAAQALAVWGVLALMVMAGRSFRARTLFMTAALLIALLVGLSRLYLAAHWMTDVLGGWALAGVWGCLLIIPYLAVEKRAPAAGPGPPSARPPHAARPAQTG